MNMSGTLPRRISRNVHDYGFLRTILKVISIAFAPIAVFRSYLIYVIKLKEPAPGPRNSSFSFRWIEPGEASLIAQVEAMEEWLDGNLHERLLKNSACLVALDRETVAAFNLINFELMSVPVLKFTRKLPSRSAWSEQITVNKLFRNRGLGADLRYAVFRELAARGVDKLYGATQRGNTSSIKLARKTGFTIFCRLYYLKIFSHQKWFYRRIRNGCDF